MHGVAKRLLLSFVVCLCVVAIGATSLYAASTGQIKGRLTDKETGEPVIGASVLVVGTKFGGMSDPDGRYMIARLDPGTYTLRVSSVDYSTVDVSNVEVKSDFTTEVNQKLVKKVTDLDVKIEVIATQDPIQKYETSNQVSITSAAIQKKPVQTVDALLKNVAGVQTTTSGQVFIRGGRAGEVAYIVDGVPIGDPLGGTGGAGANLSLVSGSIQEIQIIKDGFDPEYGNALSGIVKLTSQTGNKDNTRINMQYITDDLGTQDLNKYSRNYDFIRGSISGPDQFLTKKILPAFGLNFLADKEFTYYLYGEMDLSDGVYQYADYDTRTTTREFGTNDFFGLFNIPNRANNRYSWQANLKFRPRQNLNFILSYKYSKTRWTPFSWAYRYTSSTATIAEDKWQSLSLEMSQEISKNMSYEAVFSFYEKNVRQQPGDPKNPGKGLNPDQFFLESEWESYTDRNNNGIYDAPEPLINLYPDSAVYGADFSGPNYTRGEFIPYIDAQTGELDTAEFRFNNNGIIDNLEGEPFVDLNNNGVWDQGDYLNDKNGNHLLDNERLKPINQREPETFIDGDSIRGEPYTDINGNGVYDNGVDGFIRSSDPSINQDLNYNGRHDGPENTLPFQWESSIPYYDRNGNGIFDLPNGLYDPGEKFVDRNGNGKYDYGGSSNFLNPGSYDEDVLWHRRRTRTYRGEVKGFRQLGNHQLKAGIALSKELFSYEEIQKSYLPFTGRVTDVNKDGIPDEPYPTRGIFRDFFSYEPITGTLYFRDNLEYGSMIANIGLRWDFFLQDTEALVPVVKGDDLGSGTILGDRQKISPRIGFSYPISDKAKVHFNYGHFFQLPEYRYMYARNTTSVDANDVVGNYNLDYQKTVQYSFGVKYAMNENYAIDFSGYFKDEFDKINQQRVTLNRRTVNQYRNRDYGRSRGFELTLEKRGGGYVNGQLSYTYAFAYGKASQASENYLTDFALSREPLTEAALDNDIRHSIKSYVQFYIPNSVKPRLFGLPIPNGWALSIETIIESGRPFTPDSKYPNLDVSSSEEIERNSLRYPATAYFDIRFNKEFKFVGMDYSFILWVENVFDTRNADAVYSTTGRADTQQNISGLVFQGTDYDQNPGNWGYGRQVRVGLEMNL